MFAPLFGVCLLSLAATSPNDEVFERVVEQARGAATLPYQPNEITLPEVLRELNYDTYRMITFRRELGLWFGDRTRFQVQCFHPGYIYKEPVTMNQVVDGKVEPVDFSSKFFRYPRFDPVLISNAKLGFAGFRLLYPLAHSKPVDEVIAFVGASYFRALATGQVYGISARGLAIDTSDSMPEEFPDDSSEFWLCKPAPARANCSFSPASIAPGKRRLIASSSDPAKRQSLDIETRSFLSQIGQRSSGLRHSPACSGAMKATRARLTTSGPEVHDSDTLVIENAVKRQQESCPLQQVDRVTTRIVPWEKIRRVSAFSSVIETRRITATPRPGMGIARAYLSSRRVNGARVRCG